MNKFKVSGISFGASFIWFIICMFTIEVAEIFAMLSFFVSLVMLIVSVCFLIGGVTDYIKNNIKFTTKPKYKETDDKDFLEKANKIEQECNNNIQHFQELINKNTKDREELATTLKTKKEEKSQVDNIINNFIKQNKIKIGKGITVNMINNTIEYYANIISMEDITGVQVKCNSKIVTESNTVEERKARRGLVSTVGRATVGVALTGGMPVGAVLGLTGTKKTKSTSNTTTTQKEVNTYTVIILTNNIKNSVFSINCGDSETDAIRISNAINNACINMGMLDTKEHEVNLQMSAKLSGEIQALKDKINALDGDVKRFNKTIKDLNKQCNKQIKQLKKELKKDAIN